MNDRECIDLLLWALPRLRLHWPGYRKVRGQVCKRVARRLQELALADAAAYRDYLQAHDEEWKTLESFCSISISRFYRDRGVFGLLEREVLPELAAAARRDGHMIECWSAGCASGEEVYSLAALWELRLARRFSEVGFHVLGTDVDGTLLERSARACYKPGSVKELPPDLRAGAFTAAAEELCVRESLRQRVEFARQDIRTTLPQLSFDLVLCRNLVFTYFEPELQREVLDRVLERLRPRGVLVIGIHERLPQATTGLAPWPGASAVFRKLERRTN